MRVIEILTEQSDKGLQINDWPLPKPGPGQVLIQVKAAGVNRPDWMQRQGLYPAPPSASPILGLEVAGIVLETGPDTHQFKPGDRVCALVNGGGYAEFALAEQSCVLPIPHGYSWIEAAALPECVFTVWSNLVMFGKLQAGESVLIHGGGSGIGTNAIQIAKNLGALVFVTTGSDEKVKRCLALGADVAINYQQDDFVERVKTLTQGAGVNLILDIMGGDYLQRNIHCLAVEGRLQQIAIQADNQANLKLWPIMLKRLQISGSSLRNRDLQFKADLCQQIQHHVWPWLEQNLMHPVIDSVFALELAELAHERLNHRDHFGKIILEV